MFKGMTSDEILGCYGEYSSDDEYYSDYDDQSSASENSQNQTKKKIKPPKPVKKEKIKTRFNELSFEVLLHVMDYVFPFFTHFEKITLGSSINFNDRRMSNTVLTQVLHSLFASKNIKTWVSQYCGKCNLLGNKYGDEFKYLNSARVINVESLMMRQLVIDEIVKEFYNYIRISKTFYSFLINDCYDLLVVKLVWEGLYQCIRNPDTVLSNSRESFNNLKPLPASQYILTEPVYSAVLRSRFEPVWFYQLFLTQPSFGFTGWIKWTRSRNHNESNSEPSNLEWKQFLKFLQKQISRYSLLKTESKYYSKITTNFDYIKENKFDPDEISKIIYIDLEIPVGSNRVLHSIDSPKILKQIMQQNAKKSKNSTDICCKNNDLFISALINLRFDILGLIMDIQKNKISEMSPKYLEFSPVHALIETSLKQRDFKKQSHKIIQTLKSMRNHFLPIADILTIESRYSNPLFFLINKVQYEYSYSKFMERPSDYFGVFEAFYPVFVSELDEEVYEKVATSPNIIVEACSAPLFHILFDNKMLPAHVLDIHEKLLAIPVDNVFGNLLTNFKNNISQLKIAFKCVKKNPFAFKTTLKQNEISGEIGRLISVSNYSNLKESEITYLKKKQALVDTICNKNASKKH